MNTSSTRHDHEGQAYSTTCAYCQELWEWEQVKAEKARSRNE